MTKKTDRATLIRNAMFEATCQLRNAAIQTQSEIKRLDAEIDAMRFPCARLTYLGDKKWDAEAKLKMLYRQIDAKAEEVAAKFH